MSLGARMLVLCLLLALATADATEKHHQGVKAFRNGARVMAECKTRPDCASCLGQSGCHYCDDGANSFCTSHTTGWRIGTTMARCRGTKHGSADGEVACPGGGSGAAATTATSYPAPEETVTMPTAKVTSKCIFIRHGQSQWNAHQSNEPDGVGWTTADVFLTKKGLVDAVKTGEALLAAQGKASKTASVTVGEGTYTVEEGLRGFMPAAVTADNTALLTSNLDRAQMTGVLGALEVDADPTHWQNYIVSSLQEAAKGIDASSNLDKFSRRDFAATRYNGMIEELEEIADDRKGQATIVMEKARVMWSKGNHWMASRAQHGYISHFPKYVSYLSTQGVDFFLIAGHSHWWRYFVMQYGDDGCKAIGSMHKGAFKPGHLSNGMAVKYEMVTEGDTISLVNCAAVAGTTDGPVEDESIAPELREAEEGDMLKMAQAAKADQDKPEPTSSGGFESAA